MYEAVLSVIILGMGMFLWNTRVENVIVNRISRHLKKDSEKSKNVFIDPR